MNMNIARQLGEPLASDAGPEPGLDFLLAPAPAAVDEHSFLLAPAPTAVSDLDFLLAPAGGARRAQIEAGT